jgi:hypothetical protein
LSAHVECNCLAAARTIHASIALPTTGFDAQKLFTYGCDAGSVLENSGINFGNSATLAVAAALLDVSFTASLEAGFTETPASKA